MKKIIGLFTLGGVHLFSAISFAQVPVGNPVIAISYDASGNRFSRQVINMQNIDITDTTQTKLQDSTVLADNITQQSGENINGANNNSGQENSGTQYNDNLGGQKITVYPNPTKGWLTVQLSNFTEGVSADISIYDLQNKLLMKKHCYSEYTKVDVSALQNGEYIMNIVIGGEMSGWKIVKQ
jgi:hypothetical protein